LKVTSAKLGSDLTRVTTKLEENFNFVLNKNVEEYKNKKNLVFIYRDNTLR
jgi:hypothetical protein